MDPTAELAYFRSLRGAVAGPDILDALHRGLTHVWSQIRDETTRVLIPAMPAGARRELSRRVMGSVRDGPGPLTWQATVGTLDALRVMHNTHDADERPSDDHEWLMAYARRDALLGDATPNVRTSAVRLVTALGGIPVGVILDRLRCSLDISLTESYLTLLVTAIVSAGPGVVVADVSAVLLPYTAHAASTIRQCVSDVFGALVTSAVSGRVILDLLASLDRTTWEHTECVLMILETVVTAVLMRHTLHRYRHVDPARLDTPDFIVPPSLVGCVSACSASAQFEHRRMALLLLPLLAHAGLLWHPSALCDVVDALGPAAVLLRREVLWALVVLTEPTSSRYTPRLSRYRNAVLRACCVSSDAVTAAIATAYLGYPLHTLWRGEDLPPQWAPILPDVASSPLLSLEQRIIIATHCVAGLVAPRGVPLYTSMTLLEALAQSLALLTCPSPRFLACCPTDTMYSTPRLSNNPWSVVPNAAAATYARGHPILASRGTRYYDTLLSPRCVTGPDCLHELAEVASQKGIELPVFKMLLFIGAHAVRRSTFPATARTHWIEAVSRRLEAETIAAKKGQKSSNSFDDTTDEDEAGGAHGTTISGAYDYDSLEGMYTEFISFLWEEEAEEQK